MNECVAFSRNSATNRYWATGLVECLRKLTLSGSLPLRSRKTHLRTIYFQNPPKTMVRSRIEEKVGVGEKGTRHEGHGRQMGRLQWPRSAPRWLPIFKVVGRPIAIVTSDDEATQARARVLRTSSAATMTSTTDSPRRKTLLEKLHTFAYFSSGIYALFIALLATPFFQRQ